jgi:hypothetical protein
MSSVNVIATIIVLLAALVCYAFVSQTLRAKREQRNRVLTALKARGRNFKFMQAGFPKDFLPRDLVLLIQRNLIEVCEQLAKLEPSNPVHLQDLQSVSAQLSETQKQTRPASPVQLENPQQIKEVKMCLEELNRFIHQQELKSAIPKNQADAYRALMKLLVLQISVDNYSLQGRAAEQAGKTKLAIHYFDTALNLLIREGKSDHFMQKITLLRERIKILKERFAEELNTQNEAEIDSPELDENQSEWSSFDEQRSEWKKKQVYD